MTFSQLQSFALVARLGSVKAAAARLGVSVPAVSEAIAALRRDLGDKLVVRAGRGVELTAGGQRLAAAAAEILGIADQARRAVREAQGEPSLLRVAADSAAAEHAAGPLLDAFARRTQPTEVSLLLEPASAFADALVERVADVTLGGRPAADTGGGIEALPFLRYRLIVVAAASHRLGGRRQLPPAALAGERWLTGPSGAEPQAALSRFLATHELAPDVRAFPSDAGAVSAAASGRGVMLVVAHAVVDELRRGSLIRLDVQGTPLDELWYASVLGPERRSPAASAFRHFVTTLEATQALLSRPGGVPAGHFRPPVYVTLWDSGEEYAAR